MILDLNQKRLVLRKKILPDAANTQAVDYCQSLYSGASAKTAGKTLGLYSLICCTEGYRESGGSIRKMRSSKSCNQISKSSVSEPRSLNSPLSNAYLGAFK